MCKVSVCFNFSLYFFPLNLICNMTAFRFISHFNPTHRLRVCPEFSETPKSGVFLCQLFGFVCIHFPAGDSNLRHFFATDASQTP